MATRCQPPRGGEIFFVSSRSRHTRSLRDWSSDVCSSDLEPTGFAAVTASVMARRIARAITEAVTAAKPVGSPRLRSDILVAPSGASSQVYVVSIGNGRSEERRVGKGGGAGVGRG